MSRIPEQRSRLKCQCDVHDFQDFGEFRGGNDGCLSEYERFPFRIGENTREQHVPLGFSPYVWELPLKCAQH